MVGLALRIGTFEHVNIVCDIDMNVIYTLIRHCTNLALSFACATPPYNIYLTLASPPSTHTEVQKATGNIGPNSMVSKKISQVMRDM